ncbi:MAG TPA: 5'-3' exonuclease H3TH domain-containing protein [Candidatus Limnocylindria bacterium]|nr:5'-3' exonuclease H3TH domain-containing protein [Candidatus Limnocylindria bacterium]
MHVHLVDATFELFRAYYSRPAELSPDGVPVNAVRGLVDSLLSLLRESDVTHVGCATDHVIESWRNDVFPGYKSSAGMPHDLLSQFGLAEIAIQALGLTCWPMVEDEADDALATVTARVAADSRVEQIVICSVDKDLAQCVQGERIVLRDRMRKITYDEAGVVAKFGVRPASIPDYLALVGDSSDGYPGLPGWGARSAAAVLARWEHLEAIPTDPLTWDVDVRGAGRLALMLRERWDEVQLYKRLATLNRDAEAPGTVDDLAWGGVDREPFELLCERLGFESIPGRVHRWA